MKKNNMLRIASVLLVAVLLSTCAISGAFAKYTTSGEATDSARVAKFGVEVEVEGANAFAVEYDAKAEQDYTATIAKTVIGLDGDDADTNADKVVAPGTSGDLGAFGITGTTEVAVNITKTATLSLANWEYTPEGEDTPVTYLPIVITIDEEEFSGLDIGTTYANVDEFIAAVEGAINSNNNYAPNATLAADGEYSWAWAFNGNDEGDTALGRAANATISLEVAIVVTQLD